MIRLHIVAEGQTEQTFARQVLAPHLAKHDIFVNARCVLTSRDKHGKKNTGGLTQYSKLKADITAWMKEDDNPDSFFTTMVDLYALPQDFPGIDNVNFNGDKYELVAKLEENLASQFESYKFVPYIQLHEFEALLLADPLKFGEEFLDKGEQIARLVTLVEKLGGNPELVDHGRETAPSKRIINELPVYEKNKVSIGTKVAAAIGLPTLRAKCRHFDSWLTRLESLSRG